MVFNFYENSGTYKKKEKFRFVVEFTFLRINSLRYQKTDFVFGIYEVFFSRKLILNYKNPSSKNNQNGPYFFWCQTFLDYNFQENSGIYKRKYFGVQ